MAFSARASGSSGSPQSRMLALTECILRFINFMSEQIEPNLAIGIRQTARQKQYKLVEFGIYQRPGEKNSTSVVDPRLHAEQNRTFARCRRARPLFFFLAGQPDVFVLDI